MNVSNTHHGEHLDTLNQWNYTMITQVNSTFPISHMYKQVFLCENIHKCGKLGIGHTLSNQ
jgi:hypothetical protein